MDVALAIAIEFGKAVRTAEKRQNLAMREQLRTEWQDFIKKEENRPIARILTNAYYDAYLEREKNA